MMFAVFLVAVAFACGAIAVLVEATTLLENDAWRCKCAVCGNVAHVSAEDHDVGGTRLCYVCMAVQDMAPRTAWARRMVRRRKRRLARKAALLERAEKYNQTLTKWRAVGPGDK